MQVPIQRMKDLMEEPTERNLPAPTPYLAGSNYNGKIIEAVLDNSDDIVNSFNAAQAHVTLMSEHTNFQDDVLHFPAAGLGIFPTLK